MAESAPTKNQGKARDSAISAYKDAENESKKLKACEPVRLSLALNQSVFFYEVLKDTQKACKMVEDVL